MSDTRIRALGCGVVALFLLCGLYAGCGVKEREGVVKYDDCRHVIDLKPNTFQKRFHTFTCEYRKSQSGKVISAKCVRVESDGTLFSATHSCNAAYVYYRWKHDGCPKVDPYLGYDDKCYPDPQ